MRFAQWISLLARFSVGQGTILVINLVTGFLILRLLGVEEYAIYIVASLLQSLGALGADLGMSQGVVSIGAPLRENKEAFGNLLRGAVRLRVRLFVLVTPIVLIVAYLVLRGISIGVEMAFAITVLSLAIAWVQQSASIATAALNANHDATGLVRTGMITAVARLALTAALCSASPLAIVALVVNLIGALINSRLLWRRCMRLHMDQDSRGLAVVDSSALMAFMKPLLPGIVYYLLQGQISIFLLSLFGLTVAIAEVGALGRLGQVIGVLALLNGFFVQPYFARVADPRLFAKRAVQVALLLAVGFAIVVATAMLAPQAWLFVLGPQYSGLSGELVLALVAAYLSVTGATLYTMVIATRRTRGQWLQIILGAGAQVAFLVMADVKGTREAIILNMLPAAAYVILQSGLLAYILSTWRSNDARP